MRLAEFSRRTKVPYTTAVGWRDSGKIPERQVDYVAKRLGIEPTDDMTAVLSSDAVERTADAGTGGE